MKNSNQNTSEDANLDHLLTDRNGNKLKGAARERRLNRIQRENLVDFQEELTNLEQQVKQSKLEVVRITCQQPEQPEQPDEDLIYLVAAQESRITELESQLKARGNAAGNVQRITKALLNGTLAGSICGGVILLINPSAAQLGSAFGFTAGLSGYLIGSIERQEDIRRRKNLF